MGIYFACLFAILNENYMFVYMKWDACKFQTHLQNEQALSFDAIRLFIHTLMHSILFICLTGKKNQSVRLWSADTWLKHAIRGITFVFCFSHFHWFVKSMLSYNPLHMSTAMHLWIYIWLVDFIFMLMVIFVDQKIATVNILLTTITIRCFIKSICVSFLPCSTLWLRWFIWIVSRSLSEHWHCFHCK